MNPLQNRFVTSTFAHTSELVDGIARLAREDLSAFSKERADLSAYESRMLLAFVAELRAALLEALGRLDIPLPEPAISARWSALTALTFIDIALSELQPATLRRYGALDAASAESVKRVAAELRARLAPARELLRGSGYGDLETRLEAVPEPTAETLRAVLSLARDHELVELYPEIAALAERATSSMVDVGIFGRTSSGKSSLINALVGAPALPVGATPVTALPLRVEQGEAGVLVRFAGGRTERHPLEAVAGFAAEEENPGNRLGVASLEIWVPTAPARIRFLDTPGVASRVTATTALPFAWLARCDLGLVLVAAGSALDEEDLALLAGLSSAGVEWRLLLSKADLLSEAELERSLAYLAGEAARALGGAVPAVLPVSTAAGLDPTLEPLRAEVLEPLAWARSPGDRLAGRLAHLEERAAAALVARRAAERAAAGPETAEDGSDRARRGSAGAGDAADG